MRVSAEAVHDGVSQSGFIDVVVPFRHGKLRGDDDGLPLIAVLEDLQKGQPRVVVERLKSEVIEDDEVILLDVVDHLQKASVKFGERDALDELVHGEVLDAVAQEAGLAPERADQEGLAAAGLSVHQHVLRPFDEAAVHELQERVLGQVPFFGADYIFQDGVIPETAGFQIHLRPALVPVQPLRLRHPGDEQVQCRPFVHRKRLQALVAFGHAFQFEFLQLEDGFLCVHVLVFICVPALVTDIRMLPVRSRFQGYMVPYPTAGTGVRRGCF